MLSKIKQKFIRSLQLKKFRQKYHNIVVEGAKISYEILKEGLIPVIRIYATKDWFDRHPDLVPGDIEAEMVTEQELKTISGLSTPNEILMVCPIRHLEATPDLIRSEFCLYLESVRDPGNFGTLCRIADWFGIRNVFYSPDCVDIYNPKVIQASMSSLFRIRPMSCPLESFSDYSGEFLFACDAGGNSLFDMQPLDAGLVILGNESRGLSGLAKEIAGSLISIPGMNSLGADSLNVAVAGGIVCAFLRNR